MDTIGELWKGIPPQYSGELIIAGIVFALLNCFFGYKLRKFWICLVGLLLGAGIGGVASYYVTKDLRIAAAIGAVGGILLAVLVYHMYKGGLFLLCGGLTFFMLSQFFSAGSDLARGICIVAGVVVGVLAIRYEQNIVILATSICGGIGAVQLLFSMLGWNRFIVVILLGLILAVMGIFFQRGMVPEKEKEDSLFSMPDRKKRKKKKIKRSGKSLGDMIPSFSKRKKRKKRPNTKETVIVKETGKGSGSSGKKNSPKNSGRFPDEVPLMEAESQVSGTSRESAATKEQAAADRTSYPHVIDIDVINEQISQEVQKIFQDQNEKDN